MRTAPRAQDVADLAQVSQSAVSRTFTPGASVSEATRRKVLAAAQKLGYRPNAWARSLITRRSRIVALVMSYLENQFYPLVIERLSQKLQKEGYHVLMFIAEVDEAADGVLAEILQYQVDGIVMASAMLSPNVARSCAEVGVPVVQFNRVSILGGLARHASSSVTSDNYAGGQLVARLLVERGYRRFGFLAGLEDSSTS
ncbi:MAG: LacI family DNA-binding transcriptional regulator, partial [Achromobacter mucicolens]